MLEQKDGLGLSLGLARPRNELSICSSISSLHLKYRKSRIGYLVLLLKFILTGMKFVILALLLLSYSKPVILPFQK